MVGPGSAQSFSFDGLKRDLAAAVGILWNIETSGN